MVDALLFLLAFGGGIVAFLSPCNIAMLPTFISYIQSQVKTTRKSILMSFTFSLGFVFMFAIAAGFFIIISGFITFMFWLRLISGIIIICLAIYIVIPKQNIKFDDTKTSQQMEKNQEDAIILEKDLKDVLKMEGINISESSTNESKYQGYTGALLLGLSMGSGWIACVTPIYLSIIIIAMNEKEFAIGMSLFLLFALGIIIPYLAMGAFMGKFNERFMVKLVKIGSKIQKIFCVILFLIGVEFILSAFGIPGILPFI